MLRVSVFRNIAPAAWAAAPDLLLSSAQVSDARRQATGGGIAISAADCHDRLVARDTDLEEAQRRLKEQRKEAQRSENPTVHAELALMLNNLGAELWERGRIGEALTPTDEAISIWRGLLPASPKRWQSQLARTLRNRGQFLAELDRREEAVAALRESVAMFWLAALADKSEFGALAHAFGKLIAAVGGGVSGYSPLDAMRDQCEFYAELAKLNPTLIEPHVARVVSSRASAVARLGHHDEAVRLAEVSVETFRRCAARIDAHREILGAFEQIGGLPSEAERRVAAERLVQRHPALGSVDSLLRVNPRVVSPEQVAAVEGGMASALCLLAEELAQLGRYAQALRSAEESAQIAGRLIDSQEGDFRPLLDQAKERLTAIRAASARQAAAVSQDDNFADVAALVAAGKTIEAIKRYRELTGASLAEAEAIIGSM